MDRDLTLERLLLSRSYTSEAQITQLLEDRYSITGGQRPFLPITPAEAVGGEKEEKTLDFTKNAAVKPSATRKSSARKNMRVYLKTTQANQKKAVRRLQAFQRKNPNAPIRINSLLKQYSIPRYDDYVALNHLWNQYIEDLLFGEQKNPNLNMLLPKLSSADYNGSHLTVLECRNSHLVGMAGIVLYDAQHSFILVVPQVTEAETTISASEAVGGLRIVPKKGTMFGFEVAMGDEVVGFTILGSRFELRAVDRSGKKFKSHDVEDIL